MGTPFDGHEAIPLHQFGFHLLQSRDVNSSEPNFGLTLNLLRALFLPWLLSGLPKGLPGALLGGLPAWLPLSRLRPLSSDSTLILMLKFDILEVLLEASVRGKAGVQDFCSWVWIPLTM